MWIKEEVTSNELADRLWSGAVDTWKQILDADKEDEAMSYMEDLFCCGEDGAVDITKVNDYLWFDGDDLLNALGLNEENKEYYITEEEFNTLKENGVLTQEHLQVIQETFDIGCHTVTTEEFENEGELSDEEKEELDKVVA